MRTIPARENYMDKLDFEITKFEAQLLKELIEVSTHGESEWFVEVLDKLEYKNGKAYIPYGAAVYWDYYEQDKRINNAYHHKVKLLGDLGFWKRFNVWHDKAESKCFDEINNPFRFDDEVEEDYTPDI